MTPQLTPSKRIACGILWIPLATIAIVMMAVVWIFSGLLRLIQGKEK